MLLSIHCTTRFKLAYKKSTNLNRVVQSIDSRIFCTGTASRHRLLVLMVRKGRIAATHAIMRLSKLSACGVLLLASMANAIAPASFWPGLGLMGDRRGGNSNAMLMRTGARKNFLRGKHLAVTFLADAAAQRTELTKEEMEKVTKMARSIEAVVGATLSGFIGPWIIGWIFGTVTAIKGQGIRAAMGNGVTTGTAWGLMSAAFCGVEIFARECRGKTDKWNNMMGACSAGVVGNAGKGAGAMASGCVNFAAMSYIIDLFIGRNKDPFDELAKDPSKAEEGLLGKVNTNKAT